MEGVWLVSKSMQAYLEAVAFGAAFAALAAAYQALGVQGAALSWPGTAITVASAALSAGMGYAVVALRWLSVPPEPPK